MTSGEARLAWQKIEALDQAREWHAVDPEIARGLVATADRMIVHEQRLDWAYLILRFSAQIAGLASVAVLGVVAWHYANVRATGDGLAVFCSGAAAVASVFLSTAGARLRIRSRRDRDNG